MFAKENWKLILLVAHENDAPVGIASLYMDERRNIRFVGHGRSDYSDLICTAERDDIRDAMLKSIIAESNDWNRIELRHIPASSPTIRALAATQVNSLRTDEVPCPALLIEGHQEHFDKVRNKKSLRRHHNFFRKKQGYCVEHLSTAAEIMPRLEEFFQQHIARWSDTGFPSLFNSDVNREFYRRIVQSLDQTNCLRFTRLAMGERPIAFHFGFVFADTFVWYKPCFDPKLSSKSPGEALLKELFELVAEEKHKEFDFTIGDETFKQRFANQIRQNVEVTLYRRSIDYCTQSAIHRTKKHLKSSRLGRSITEFAKRLTRG